MAAHRPRAGARGLRRWAGCGLIVLSLSALFVLVPAPRWAVAEQLDVRTSTLALPRRDVDRSREPVALEGLDAAETAERRAALASRERRSSGIRPADVRAIGVTAAAMPDGPVLVRARVRGAWTPWLEVPFADGEEPDVGSGEGRPGLHSEPVWLGPADAYEIDAPAATPALDVHSVQPIGTVRTQVPAGAAGAASAPAIRSRASWGARPPTSAPTLTGDLKLAIVHHTATGNTYSSSEVPAVLRSIQAYHQSVRGYTDIAYNVLVDRFGVAWEGRAGGLHNIVVGGHSQGFNAGSVGVSVIGDYTSAGVSNAVVETVARVIAWKLALHHVDPRSSVPFTSAGSAKFAQGRTVTLPRVIAHRDVQSTGCPGGNLYARMGALRQRVNELVPSYQAGLMPTLLAFDATGDQLTDAFEYRAGSGRDVLWRARPSGSFAKSAKSVGGAFRPAVGDFNGDGREDLFWHGTGSAADHVWWSVGQLGAHMSQSTTVSGSFLPIVGDFDGNGFDDIFWYAPGLAPDYVWYHRSGGRRDVAVTQSLISGEPLVGDFDGDGRDDIFFYAPGPHADDQLWWSQGQSWTIARPAVSGWYRPVVHDADADGRDDITWYAPNATTSHRWRFPTGRGLQSSSFSHRAVDAVPVAGDFDGDRRGDVALIGPGSRGDAVWYSTGPGVVERAVTVSGTYAVVAGRMDTPSLLALADPEDILFVSDGADYLWRGQPSRTFSSTQVG